MAAQATPNVHTAFEVIMHLAGDGKGLWYRHQLSLSRVVT